MAISLKAPSAGIYRTQYHMLRYLYLKEGGVCTNAEFYDFFDKYEDCIYHRDQLMQLGMLTETASAQERNNYIAKYEITPYGKQTLKQYEKNMMTNLTM